MEKKSRRKEKLKTNKNVFKFKKLFLYGISKSFYLFFFFYVKIK